MITNINPSNQNCVHTLNTVRYDERIKEINVNLIIKIIIFGIKVKKVLNFKV